MSKGRQMSKGKKEQEAVARRTNVQKAKSLSVRRSVGNAFAFRPTRSLGATYAIYTALFFLRPGSIAMPQVCRRSLPEELPHLPRCQKLHHLHLKQKLLRIRQSNLL